MLLTLYDQIKSAASEIRKSLFSVDFGLDDKFCDAEDLKQSWRETAVPEAVLAFCATLFNIKKMSLISNDFNCRCFDESEESDTTDEEEMLIKMKSLFQILFYQV